MSRRILSALLVTAALGVAPDARAAGTAIEGFLGWQNLQLNSSSVQNAVKGNEGTGIFGADVLFYGGGFGIGAALDKTFSGNAQPWAGSGMAGFVIDAAEVLRFDILAEGGRRGHDFGDMFNSNGQWFVGARPGVSFRFVPSAFLVGVTGLVRWPISGGDFGSPDYGILGRFGVEFP